MYISKSNSSRLSYIFVETRTLHNGQFKSKKSASVSEDFLFSLNSAGYIQIVQVFEVELKERIERVNHGILFFHCKIPHEVSLSSQNRNTSCKHVLIL